MNNSVLWAKDIKEVGRISKDVIRNARFTNRNKRFIEFKDKKQEKS